MNYILRLRLDNARLRAELDALRDDLAAFRGHLTTAKYHEDPTIQVRDVDARILEMMHRSLVAGAEVGR